MMVDHTRWVSDGRHFEWAMPALFVTIPLHIIAGSIRSNANK